MAMWTEETEARWRQLSEEVMTGMKEWRLAHPRATFKEIEAALDDRLAKVRARMLQDAALSSAAADLKRPGAAPPGPTGRGITGGAPPIDLGWTAR